MMVISIRYFPDGLFSRVVKTGSVGYRFYQRLTGFRGMCTVDQNHTARNVQMPSDLGFEQSVTMRLQFSLTLFQMTEFNTSPI